MFRSSASADAVAALHRLEGTLDETRMIRLNAEAERTKNYASAADLYFNEGAASGPQTSGHSGRSHFGESFPSKLTRWTLRHLQLAGFSLLLSIIVGIPLGIIASRGGAVGHVILGFAGVVETVPSLALLALLVPLPFLESAFEQPSLHCFSMVLANSHTVHDRFAGHPTSIAGVRGRARTEPARSSLENLSANGFALDSLRNQNQRCNKYWNCHARRVDRRWRPGRTDHKRS